MSATNEMLEKAQTSFSDLISREAKDSPTPDGGSGCPGSEEEVLSCNTETCPDIGGNGVRSGLIASV